MDINEATAKAIAAERSAAGLTIKELAHKSGIPERTLIRMLKNERDIKVLQIAQIATVFNLYPHEIVDEAEQFMQRDNRAPVRFDNAPASKEAENEVTTRRLFDGELAAGQDENIDQEREGGEGR